MPANQEIADGLSELESEFPATFIWDNQQWTCLASSESRSVDGTEFGFEASDELSLIVRLEQFGTGSRPAQRSTIIYNSRNYRINTIEKAINEAFVIYRLIRNRN